MVTDFKDVTERAFNTQMKAIMADNSPFEVAEATNYKKRVDSLKQAFDTLLKGG